VANLLEVLEHKGEGAVIVGNVRNRIPIDMVTSRRLKCAVAPL